ncbi:MAG: ribosome silencing factor [Proteobacteria bacterium]|nr:ribosome silencing factor [Pseudomonadota bacterium]
MTTTNLQLLNAVAQSIYDKKGFNILVLDVRGISTLTDYVVIAEGNIDRHIKAISSAVKHTLHDVGCRPAYVEGESTGDWVVIDCGEVTLHLMQTDVREKYALEELWRTAKIIDVQIETKKPAKE